MNMILFQVSLNSDPLKKKTTENTMSHLYFNEDCDHSEENRSDNEDFHSTILHHRNKLNIFALHLLIYYIKDQSRKS